MSQHLELVHKMVSQITTRVPAHVRRDDLVSAGMAGLVLAARHFDPSRGVPFERYAATRVRGALIDELRSSDWASRPVRARARAVASTTDALTAKLGRPPTTEELADATGISPADLSRLSDDVHRAVVINYEAVLEAGDSEMLLPVATDDPEEQLLMRERTAALVKAIAALPERHRVVVRGYFFQERTVSDLAEELGVTQSRISQLRGEAMELLRDGINAQLDPARVTPLRPVNGRLARRKAAYRATMARQGTPVAAGCAV
ncbi:MAG TPA: sigma-70 family RNA polymerase sigma factor [Acidimicrobiales bacterium]|nr:sigma-70 family RNA polymerase sigma factor [Acidimicrobiales bacterium]